jgi:succinyl-diaminopimelate desuccinylase
MTSTIDPVELTSRLIACPSVTPEEAGTLDILEEVLTSLDFEVHRFTVGEAPDGPVENLYASRGSGGPHFGFAGHVDVVPPGDGWTGDPFTPVVRGDLLYGRGAVDMKGSIAAFIAACAETPQNKGTLSFIITGDEEGPARYGTLALIDWMKERSIAPDMILIGEPTSENRLGDTVKIGRRGSANMWITVPGIQGHVAYPHRADNPVPKLAAILSALEAIHLDDGNEAFQPSNLEFTAVSTPTKAVNIIPAAATAQLNIRFNNLHRSQDLVELVRRTAQSIAPEATVEAKTSGEAFLTPPGRLFELVTSAIEAETGVTPVLSTGGGTSDGRFLIQLCPVVDFGLVNATMHKLDEAVALADLKMLQAIYARILREALNSG